MILIDTVLGEAKYVKEVWLKGRDYYQLYTN